MLKPFAWLLILGGLLLGPIYWVYITHFTGSVAASLPLQGGEGGKLVSASFRLDPAMNPVGLILKTQGSFEPTMDDYKPPRDLYQAVLYHDGVAGKPVKFQLGVKSVAESNPVFQERLLLLQVAGAGEYRLEITPLAAPEIALQHPQLEVRQQVQMADTRLVAGGIIGMGIGALLLLM